jgi:internalin A
MLKGSGRLHPLHYSIALVALASVLAQRPFALREYLRLDGTQLDLRGTSVTDSDLAAASGAEFGRVTTVLLTGTQVNDAGVVHLVGLPLRQLDLGRTEISDAALATLQRLGLERLELTSTRVTDAGLVHLKGLPLAMLTLRDTKIRGTALGSLEGMNLRLLDLSRTQIADGSIAALEKVKAIDTLDLSDTPITDQAVPHLQRIPGLSTVDLAGTKVGSEAVARLKRSRPKLVVNTVRLPR